MIITYKGGISNVDSVTSTATIGKNTSEFGPITQIDAALDCSILNFSHVVQDKEVKLNWKAVCNNDFLYFDIEHSTDGKSFTRLRTVDPKDFNRLTDYDFIHTSPDPGRNYYRLRMVNTAERAKYSSIVSVDLQSASVYGLEHMNSVFGDNIQVRVKSDKKQAISLQLFNEQGKLVRTKEINGEAGINYVQLENTGQLSAGAYFLQLSQEGERVTRKIIKQ